MTTQILVPKLNGRYDNTLLLFLVNFGNLRGFTNTFPSNLEPF